MEKKCKSIWTIGSIINLYLIDTELVYFLHSIQIAEKLKQKFLLTFGVFQNLYLIGSLMFFNLYLTLLF